MAHARHTNAADPLIQAAPVKLTAKQRREAEERAAREAIERGRLLYLIGWSEAGPIKVGIASRIRRRLAGLQVGSPYPLQAYRTWVIGAPAPAVEDRVKDELAAHAMMGEWFSVNLETASAAVERILGLVPSEWFGKANDELDAFIVGQHQAQGELRPEQVFWTRPGMGRIGRRPRPSPSE